MQLPLFKLTSLALLLLCLSCGRGSTAKDGDNCACPLEKVKTIERGKAQKEAAHTGEGDGSLLLDIPYIKKYVNAEIKLSGGIEQLSKASEQVYWEILNQNPEVTQYAHLFQLTTCALYIIACEDSSISKEEQEREKRAIIRAYETRLEGIIEASRNIQDNRQADVKEEGVKEVPDVPQQQERKEHYEPIKPTASFSGYILDAATRHPIEGAIIRKDDKVLAQSDHVGHFDFKYPIEGQPTDRILFQVQKQGYLPEPLNVLKRGASGRTVMIQKIE